MLHRLGHRIIKSGLPVRDHSQESAAHLDGIVREKVRGTKAEANLFIEVNHKHLVMGIAGFDKRHGRSHNPARLPCMLPLLSIAKPTVTGTSFFKKYAIAS